MVGTSFDSGLKRLRSATLTVAVPFIFLVILLTLAALLGLLLSSLLILLAAVLALSGLSGLATLLPLLVLAALLALLFHIVCHENLPSKARATTRLENFINVTL
jgi:hypothetical protein